MIRPVGLLALLAAVAVAGCTGPSGQAGTLGTRGTRPSSEQTTAPGRSSSPGRPSEASILPSPTTSTPPSTSATPADPTVSALPTPSPTPAARSTCRRITIRVLRGSGAPGYEFAALQFVNDGRTRCVLNGYPTVTLRRGGVRVGDPSQPAGAAPSTFTLAPGAVAESRLLDYSTCQAPLSDEIRVVAPGSTIASVRPGQLRACTLRVSPLVRPE